MCGRRLYNPVRPWRCECVCECKCIWLYMTGNQHLNFFLLSDHHKLKRKHKNVKLYNMKRPNDQTKRDIRPGFNCHFFPSHFWRCMLGEFFLGCLYAQDWTYEHTWLCMQTRRRNLNNLLNIIKLFMITFNFGGLIMKDKQWDSFWILFSTFTFQLCPQNWATLRRGNREWKKSHIPSLACSERRAYY